MIVADIDGVFHGEAIGRKLPEENDIGVADDFAVERRDEMRQLAVAEILAPVAQIVRLRHAGVLDARLDAAVDVAAVDRQHRLDIGVARGAHDDGRREFRQRRIGHGRISHGPLR